MSEQRLQGQLQLLSDNETMPLEPSAVTRDQLVTLIAMSTELILRDLDEARRRRGMSKTDLAERAGTQPSAVRRLFTSEERVPNLATVAALAAALDYEVRVVPRGVATSAAVPSGLADELRSVAGAPFATVLADPPWRFINRTGKVAPEHGRLSRYDTMTTAEIAALPVRDIVEDKSHLYLWVPNALIADGLAVMEAWGFTYKANVVWAKRRKDGGPDGRGVGFYFRNVTELLLFGVRGSMRTLAPGRRQVNMIETRKREHSRKPDEQYDLIEACSPGPYLEMFARYPRTGWSVWGNEADESITPRGRKYKAYS
jgi:N6-adenosine-specific RNA methylase IME4/DNA-binding phage protein